MQFYKITLQPLVVAIFAIAFFCVDLTAQVDTDSLWNVWQNTEMTDSIRLNALHDMARDGLLSVDPDSAAQLAEMKFHFAEEKDMGLQKARALLLIGIANFNKGDYTEALVKYYEALEIIEELGNESEMTRALNNIGNVYVVQAQYDQAIDYFTRTLRIQERLGDQIGMAGTLNNIGVIYFDQGDDPQAMEFFSRCLDILEDLEHKRGMASMLTNLALVYENMGKLDEALDKQFESLRLEEEVGDKHAMALTLNNIGLIYKLKGDYENALVHIDRGRGYAEEIGDQKEISTSLTNLSRVYSETQQHGLAIESGREGLRLAEGTGVIRDIRNAAESLYYVYREAGRSTEALEMYELYIAMRDSILNRENQREVMRQHFTYEMEKREALAEAEQEKIRAVNREQIRRKNLQLNAFIGGLVLMSLLAGVFLVQRRRIGKEKERSDGLLLNILPKETADELKAHGHAESRYFDEVSVLFTDFVGFTKFSEKMEPGEVVEVIHECFSIFDDIVARHGVEKIKTIGDAYMAAGGLPSPNETHAVDVVRAAIEMQEAMIQYFEGRKDKGLPAMGVRVGINTGPVVAGIVGKNKFQYDIWGDTVNTAARMESSGKADMVNVSESTYQKINGEFDCVYRGKIHAKNKGEIGMYFVSSVKKRTPELA